MVSSDYRAPNSRMSELPGPLRLTSTFPFVGRSAELEGLRALMPSGEEAGGRVVLLGGEPGSGKSRLVREFAAEAAADGALVLYGSCDAEVRTPYGAFVEALDQLARTTDPDELRAALGGGGSDLTRLLPDLGAACGRAPAGGGGGSGHRAPPAPHRGGGPAGGDHAQSPGAARAGGRPLGRRSHPAPPAPARAGRERADAACSPRSGTPRPTCRPTSRRRSPTCAATTPSGWASTGSPATRWRSSCEARRGRSWVPRCSALAAAIRELTDGNAFLVCELWRALEETGAVEVVDGTIRVTGSPAELGSPESVREVVSQRLSRLKPGTSDLLELAATAGAEFELDVVRRAAGLGEPELLGALDEAVRSGMIEEFPAQGLACRFTHELVRRALYDRLSGPRRAELHLRVGEALEESSGEPFRAGGGGPGASLRGGRALRRQGARRGVQRARRAGGHRGAGLRRGGGAAAHRAGAGNRQHRGAPARSRSSSGRRATGPARRSTRWRRTGRRRTSPGSWGTRRAWRARRSATRTPAGARG